MSNTQTDPVDILSEYFADFALDEMEEDERTSRHFILKGQEFTATVLGFGSSYSESGSHTGHMPGTRPVPGERCAACRWADVAILSIPMVVAESGACAVPPTAPTYVLVLMGKSVVPGEENRVKTVWSPDPAEVLKNLEVPGKGGAPAKIPVPNARAFRYAAFADPGIFRVLSENEHIVPDVRLNR